ARRQCRRGAGAPADIAGRDGGRGRGIRQREGRLMEERLRTGWAAGGRTDRGVAADDQARRSAIAPTTMIPAPKRRWGVTRSWRIKEGFAIPNRIEVSRRAAITALGATVIAHSARP